MNAYSLDLRQRILDAVQRGEGTLRELAQFFGVDLSTIVRLLRRHRQTGSVQPKPHAGGPTPCLDKAATNKLLRLVRKQPDATLAELRDRLGVPCSVMTIWRALKRHRISRKKKTLRARERDQPEVQHKRQEFQQQLAAVDPEHLVYVDEAGVTTKLARTQGRAPVGERVYDAVPGKWESMTLISGLRLSGVVAPLAFAGSTDGPAFLTYVRQGLVPQLRRGDVVIWDNLQPHKAKAVEAAVAAVGATVLPAPPWSPDLIPIEEMFSKVKETLRSLAARTRGAVMKGLGVALNLITPKDIRGWFQDRASYAMH
jgi:transposase